MAKRLCGMEVTAPDRPRFDKNARARDIARAIYDQKNEPFAFSNGRQSSG